MNKHTDHQRSTNFIKAIRCAVLDTSKTIGDDDISQYTKQITYNFLRNNYSHYRHKIYEEDSVDKILADLANDPEESDIVLLVVQAYGNILYDTWQPLEHGYSLFREYCNYDWLEDARANKFLLMGHILDDQNKDRWFRLHEQCFVINYPMWKAMGRPAFGDFGVKPQEVREAIRSTENFHDGHTPKYLSPGTEQVKINRTGFGWNLINESLKAGLSVLNFDEQARKTKTYLYPEIKEEQEEFKKFFREDCAKFKAEESNLGQTKKDFLQYQSYTVQRSPDAIWVMNTESVNDVVFVPRKFPLKNIYSVAAGFKTFAFLKNWNPDTDVENVGIHYFDISANSLEARKWVHTEWDPRDFNQYLDYLHDEWYKTDKALISIYEDFDFMSPNWESEREKAKEAYQKSILRIFDTMEDFYEMHEKVKHNPNITYGVADLCRDYQPLIDRIQPHEEGFDSVCWSSNYITTRYTTWLLSYEERRDIYQEVVEKMCEKNKHLRLHSADWDGSPTRGMKLEEINHAYGYPEELFLKWRSKRN